MCLVSSLCRIEKERNGAPRLRVSNAGFVALLLFPLLSLMVLWFDDVKDDEENTAEEVFSGALARAPALLNRRPGAAEGSSAQSLKRPSTPREAKRFG